MRIGDLHLPWRPDDTAEVAIGDTSQAVAFGARFTAPAWTAGAHSGKDTSQQFNGGYVAAMGTSYGPVILNPTLGHRFRRGKAWFQALAAFPATRRTAKSCWWRTLFGLNLSERVIPVGENLLDEICAETEGSWTWCRLLY